MLFNSIWFILNFIIFLSAEKILSIDFSYCWLSSGFKTFKASACLFPWSWIVFVCFSKALPRGEHVNLACSVSPLCSEGNISWPVRG